ncbi:uroporphyrinogen-III synthase [Methyloligella halotolerans]|uniref:Uroporphyrinogen-III synthase n=1 Tax=Methyloligella halotolerans TaxID=1177755 RepID=A0A1E2S0D9_9HYPH|nr:uroporphyrinogen-III synthase [Methyloligella halotolerans]ODA67934.1 uroporphyrinogen-III synthase [Methyloligella halotolerans]
MRLLVTRPESDAEIQAALLREHGHQPVVSPLLEIEFLGPPMDLYRAQALIATSRNGLRALARLSQRDVALRLPLLAVGAGTAAMARDMGFEQVTEGPGTGEELARIIVDNLDPAGGKLIHLAGETLAFDLKRALERYDFDIEAPVLYRSVPAKSLTPEAAEALAGRTMDGVILMSPRTAQIFARLNRNNAAELASLYCFCLSSAVATNVEGFGLKLRVAAKPSQEELLALIAAEAASS